MVHYSIGPKTGTEKYILTLKNSSEIGVTSTRVSKFHMLIRPPGDALLHQRNCNPGSIGIEVNQFQRVCGNSGKQSTKLANHHIRLSFNP